MNFLMNGLRHLTLAPAAQTPLRLLAVESFRKCSSVTAAAAAAPIQSPSVVASSAVEAPVEPRLDKLYKRIELEIRGHDPAVIKSYCKFTALAASHLGVEIVRSWPLRKSAKERYTLLKSRHVHKKHRVQYEIRTYYHFVHFARVTESTSDTMLEYLERNLPEGVAMKVTKLEIRPLLEHLQPPTRAERTNE